MKLSPRLDVHYTAVVAWELASVALSIDTSISKSTTEQLNKTIPCLVFRYVDLLLIIIVFAREKYARKWSFVIKLFRLVCYSNFLSGFEDYHGY